MEKIEDGVLAAPTAPLDVQDGELVESFEDTIIHWHNPRRGEGYTVAADYEAMQNARSTLLSRLSSLRESVASLAAQRDSARDLCAHLKIEVDGVKAERDAAVKALAGSVIETKVAEMERGAARKALARLDSACQDLGAAALERWGYRAPSYLEKQWDAVAEALVESSAALSPTPSPKEAR